MKMEWIKERDESGGVVSSGCERTGGGQKMRPRGLKPTRFVDALRGAEAPLFHGCAGSVVEKGASVVLAKPRSLASLGMTTPGIFGMTALGLFGMTKLGLFAIGPRLVWLAILFIALMAGVGCSTETPVAASKAPVTLDPDVFSVSDPQLFKTAKAETRALPTELMANGTVTPDVNRTIHVTSLGGGRVIDLKVKLGDSVTKGQTLLVISSPDLAGAMSDYQKARADEVLSRKALERAQLLYDKGAIAAKDLETAQDMEDKAKVDVATAEQHVRVLGADPAHPGALIDLRAPVAGTIVEQNVAGFEGVKSLDNTPNLFTIADLSQVWVVCDVFENDLGDVHMGDAAEIRLNAFEDRVFRGTVADISRVLDPNTRSAKVRIVLQNRDGALRPGMFAVAKFRSRKVTNRVVVPATAIMRLHDKDWVFRKEGGNSFRRVVVQADGLAPDGVQEIREGVKPGDEVVANALEFSTEVAEKK